MTLLDATDLSIGYGDRLLASGIGLSLDAGSIMFLLGPNGVGKTTLFKTLLGLIPAKGGVVRLSGDDVRQLSRRAFAQRVSYVPQASPTAFAYKVLDLVVMGRTSHLGTFGAPSRRDHEQALAALETLGIAGLAQHETSRISGGQLQLVLIARALAQGARVIFMDEPTASLDLGNRIMVLDRIRKLAADGFAVLVSTHEPEQALSFDAIVAVLSKNDFVVGRAAQLLTSARLSGLYGTPLLVERTPSGKWSVSQGEGDIERDW
ncbi:MAG: hemin import ATP-binding protein HmuV [Hyphomicrobiales bacterium]|nr:hemin import ATP-binding protein HmuV [Hyphomicrobiales bacterium]